MTDSEDETTDPESLAQPLTSEPEPQDFPAEFYQGSQQLDPSAPSQRPRRWILEQGRWRPGVPLEPRRANDP